MCCCRSQYFPKLFSFLEISCMNLFASENEITLVLSNTRFSTTGNQSQLWKHWYICLFVSCLPLLNHNFGLWLCMYFILWNVTSLCLDPESAIKLELNRKHLNSPIFFFILQAEAIILLARQLDNFVLAPRKYPKPYADHDVYYSSLS